MNLLRNPDSIQQFITKLETRVDAFISRINKFTSDSQQSKKKMGEYLESFSFFKKALARIRIHLDLNMTVGKGFLYKKLRGKAYEEQLKNASEELASIGAEIESLDAELQSLEEQEEKNIRHEKLNKELEEKLLSLEKENTTLKNQVEGKEKLELENQKFQEENSEQKEKIDEFETELKALKVAQKEGVRKLELAMFIQELTERLSRNSAEKECEKCDDDVLSLYFVLKHILESISVIPLPDLEAIEIEALRVNQVESMLMLYEEKIKRVQKNKRFDQDQKDRVIQGLEELRDRSLSEILDEN